MKILAMTAVGVIVGVVAQAREPVRPTAESTVVICMGYTPNAVADNRARVVATDIFAGIGVKLAWRLPGNCPADGIVITFSNDTPASVFPGALAYAMPYEGKHTVVFYDRVKDQMGTVLGHVIAHEVTHILQGVIRHSESGVMKANWTGADYQAMTWKPLEFTREDIDIINCGLERRAKHLVAVAASTTTGSGTAAR
jgi:hypothetical protein